MIQRVQSLWLLLAALAAFLTLKFSFYSGNIAIAGTAKEFKHLNATGSLLLLVLTVATAITGFIAIFLYKNRKLQLRITLAAFAASVLVLALYYLETKKFIEGSYAITAIIALLVPIFLVLAARGIRKDEKLVKSLDRLR